ncbi:MAG: cytidylyltransferase domain-containing protein [Flavobacteriales bacterium]
MQAFIIQARTGSSRMPNKIMLPFAGGLTILDITIRMLRTNFPQLPIIMATTQQNGDDSIVDYCNSNSIPVYRGDENNVLLRTIKAAETHGVKDIIRICSDNPFLYPPFVQALIDDQSGADYVSYSVESLPTIRTHFGLFAERVQKKALDKAWSMEPDAFYQEHVTNFIYGHPDTFSLKWLDIQNHLNELGNLRLTIDDPQDFETVSSIYSSICSPEGEFSLNELRKHLAERPELMERMAENKAKYSK